jgi:hypothetical protein
MALVVADRVKENTITTGTGAVTLAGAVTNFVTFASVLSDSDTTYYAIVDDTNNDFEVGLGTFTASGTTLSRDTILASSNGGSVVNLSAGTKEVFINYPAGKSVYLDGSGQLVIGGTAVTATAAEINYLDITTLGTSEASKAVTADANGDVALSEELKAKSYNETYASVTSSSNATTVDCEAANSFAHTLTENTTFTFSNPPASGTAYTLSLEIIQDASASGYTVTWPGSVIWPNATAPTLTATANAKDVFVFYTRDGGTAWYGFTSGQAFG